MTNLESQKRYPCPCCGFYTLDIPERGSYDICPVCFWEDDLMQFEHPDAPGGANKLSLNVCRANFAVFGASERRFIQKVRSPLPDEVPLRLCR
jgi:hypothetical protein